MKMDPELDARRRENGLTSQPAAHRAAPVTAASAFPPARRSWWLILAPVCTQTVIGPPRPFPQFRESPTGAREATGPSVRLADPSPSPQGVDNGRGLENGPAPTTPSLDEDQHQQAPTSLVHRSSRVGQHYTTGGMVSRQLKKTKMLRPLGFISGRRVPARHMQDEDRSGESVC